MPNSTVDMEAAPLEPNGMPSKFVFEKTVNLAAAGNSAAIMIPPGIQNVAVTLSVASGGTGKVQTTTDKVYDVKNSASVVWIDWDSGVVAVNTQDVCIPVTAIRLVQASVGGTTQLSVRAS